MGIGFSLGPMLALTLFINAQPSRAQEFEVSSIKPNASGASGALIQALPGRLVLTNFAVRQLILSAYGVQDFQLLGDPSWIASDHYDVQAKASGNTSVKEMEGPMLRALLEDRFHLALHRETRQLPVYELTVAKAGVKMQVTSEGGCTPYDTEATPPPPPAPGAVRPTFCGYPRMASAGLNRTLDGAGVSTAVLAGNLSRSERRPILDKTGLKEKYDVHLRWAVDAPSDSTENPTAPSIFTAVQEQLGLKLESTKGPVEVLVIDRIEKPSAN
jgi:uncharacterized protein (TIGR03435 family)